MKFTIQVQNEKAPFFLELIQQLDFVKLEKMESEESESIPTMVNNVELPQPQINKNASDEVSDLQNEINDFFGK